MYAEFIVRNPEIMQGKPIIKGTRITVELVIRKLSEGYSIEEILEMYPHLNKLQILAALEYAAEVIAKQVVIEI
ncbi:MAG: DUF433 domain-containing protein [Thermoflexibacteraceae bacterium]|jgi:uncharacterized protein (DUF433 family)